MNVRAIAITAFALSLFNTWVLFEETVIDRLGWWQYLPCYRKGAFCEWDIGAIVIITVVGVLLYRSGRKLP